MILLFLSISLHLNQPTSIYRGVKMLNPGSEHETCSPDDVLALLVSIHGSDTSAWPAEISEALRADADAYILRQQRASRNDFLTGKRIRDRMSGLPKN